MLVIKKLGRNKTEVRSENAVILVSYETPVAAIVNGVRVRTATKWSLTTERHIKKWLDGYPALTMTQGYIQNLI